MEKLDPDTLTSGEVLAHLNQLGYKNISQLQLSDFMHDLKKLIKYEEKCRHGFGDFFDGNHSKNTFSSSSSQKVGSEYVSGEDYMSTDSSELCTNCNIFKSEVASDVISPISSCSDSQSTKKRIRFSHQTITPQPSFIRPWKLQPSCKGQGTASFKSDPVQMYHRYKELWAQQKVPGEKSHSQLRWTIREKMLGRDPHPRVSSCQSPKHQMTVAADPHVLNNTYEWIIHWIDII